MTHSDRHEHHGENLGGNPSGIAIAFLDAPSGISGDMFLGCLVDAGWPLSEFHAVVAAMGLPDDDWSIREEEVMRGPLRATLVNVEAQEGHVHRHLSDIRTIISDTDLSSSIKANAIAVFTRLAQAEAAVHGMAVESIHFHEVGAVDAIVDVTAAAIGLARLGVSHVSCGPVALGHGSVDTLDRRRYALRLRRQPPTCRAHGAECGPRRVHRRFAVWLCRFLRTSLWIAARLLSRR